MFDFVRHRMQLHIFWQRINGFFAHFNFNDFAEKSAAQIFMGYRVGIQCDRKVFVVFAINNRRNFAITAQRTCGAFIADFACCCFERDCCFHFLLHFSRERWYSATMSISQMFMAGPIHLIEQTGNGGFFADPADRFRQQRGDRYHPDVPGFFNRLRGGNRIRYHQGLQT